MSATWRYGLALPGSALAGWVILADPHGKNKNGARTIIGLAFLAYALAAGLIVSPAGFFPASLLNGRMFLSVFGFPIQLVRAGCAAAGALGAWLIGREYVEPDRSAYLVRNRFLRWVIPLSVALLLGVGLWTTVWRGQAVDARNRDYLLVQISSIARTIDEDRLRDLSFTPEDASRPSFVRLRKQMADYAKSTGIRRLFAVASRNGAFVMGPSCDSERNGGEERTG